MLHVPPISYPYFYYPNSFSLVINVLKTHYAIVSTLVFIIPFAYSFFGATAPQWAGAPLIHEVSISHTTTHHSR